MCYPRFTKVIIDYFMSKDQSISRRNKMFWHTARDDPMFNTIRVISKHQDTQIYGTILPDELINHEIKDSEAYKQYYAIASGAEHPKAKTKSKKNAGESDTSPKKKTAPLATKRSKIQFRSSHASSSGDGADTQSEVPNEQQQKVSGTYEGAGDRPEVPDVPEYKSESEEESWTFSQGDDDDDDDNDEHDLEDEKDDEDDDDKNNSEETESDDDRYDFIHLNLSTYKAYDQEEEKADGDDEVSFDQKVPTPPDHKFTEEEENQDDDDYVKE
ncbi:hypothetical protein Tco_1008657 [Tanacetum coccineum]